MCLLCTSSWTEAFLNSLCSLFFNSAWHFLAIDSAAIVYVSSLFLVIPAPKEALGHLVNQATWLSVTSANVYYNVDEV